MSELATRDPNRPRRHHGDHANPGAVLARRHEAERVAAEAREAELAEAVVVAKADLADRPNADVRNALAIAEQASDEVLERAAIEEMRDRRERFARRAERLANTPSTGRAQ